MTPLLLGGLAFFCMVAALIVIVGTLRAREHTPGQEVLMKVTREAGRTTVIEAEASTKQRILDPIMRMMLRLGKRLTPIDRIHRLEDRIEHAGYPAGWDINRAVSMKAICLFIGAGVGLLLAEMFGMALGIFAIPGLAILGFYVPDFLLNKMAESRTTEMRRRLADTVDMLNLTLEAGISFDSALRLVAENTTGPLADEFGRVVQEITIGKSRSEALHALAERAGDDDLRRFCSTCVQAERRGTPFGEVLSAQSKELRVKQRQDAEMRAQKVPVKILFPMMMFVLPTLGIIVMGPAAYQIMQNMGGG